MGLDSLAVTPDSLNRLPSISEPRSGTADGRMSPMKMVTAIGKTIFSTLVTSRSCRITSYNVCYTKLLRMLRALQNTRAWYQVTYCTGPFVTLVKYVLGLANPVTATNCSMVISYWLIV